MRAPWSIRPARGAAWAALAAASLIAVPVRAALTPKSPEVKAAVEKALRYLEHDQDPRSGAKALFGLALMKGDAKPDNARVQDALKAVLDSKGRTDSLDVYTLGLSVIFLLELDPERYRADIQFFLDALVKVQKPHGGWGYAERTTGDTSMTQYGVLAMWEATRLGFKPPADSWERVANWLLRTQDPNGAWGYQGNDPGSFELVPQMEVRHSMASAGLGSLLICADHFGQRTGATRDPNLPAELKRVRKDEDRRGVPTAKVDMSHVTKAFARGDEWMKEKFAIEGTFNLHYYLYAFERYQAFRELATGQPFSHPAWYDDGAQHLLKTQRPDGAWQSSAFGLGPDTAFAVLFLVRSSRKSIEQGNHLGPGTLVGGRGLPTEGNDLTVRFGKLAAKPLTGPAEQLLAAIEDPGHPDFLRAVEGFEESVESAPLKEIDKLRERLRKLAGDGAPESRVTAVRALARTRDMDQVPVIVAALSDPDDRVFLAAEEALEFMSRTFPSRDADEDVTPARRATATRKWKAWYLAIRPNARLDD